MPEELIFWYWMGGMLVKNIVVFSVLYNTEMFNIPLLQQKLIALPAKINCNKKDIVVVFQKDMISSFLKNASFYFRQILRH